MFDRYDSQINNINSFEWNISEENDSSNGVSLIHGILYEIDPTLEIVEAKYYSFYNNYRLYRYDNSEEKKSFLNLFFPKLKLISKDNINGFYLKSHKKGRMFVCDNYQKALHWYEILKKFCVQKYSLLNYTLLKELGRGSFSLVVLAKKFNDQNKYALKFFSKANLISKKSSFSNFVNEIKIVNTLNHPHVIKLNEILYNQKNFIMVLEYLSGGNLNDYLMENRPSETEIKSFSREFAKTMEYIHSKNIIHRDLKPENIVLSSLNDINSFKIIDFGLSTFYKPGEKINMKCGSLGYVAPEILQGDYYTQRVDLFSFGSILFFILTNQDLFIASSKKSLHYINKNCLHNIQQRLLNIHSYEVKDLIIQLIEKSSEKRISSFLEVKKHPWFSSNQNESSKLVCHNLNNQNSINKSVLSQSSFTNTPQPLNKNCQNQISGEKGINCKKIDSPKLEKYSTDSIDDIPEELSFIDAQELQNVKKEFLLNKSKNRIFKNVAKESKDLLNWMVNKSINGLHFNRYKVHLPTIEFNINLCKEGKIYKSPFRQSSLFYNCSLLKVKFKKSNNF